MDVFGTKLHTERAHTGFTTKNKSKKEEKQRIKETPSTVKVVFLAANSLCLYVMS